MVGVEWNGMEGVDRGRSMVRGEEWVDGWVGSTRWIVCGCDGVRVLCFNNQAVPIPGPPGEPKPNPISQLARSQILTLGGGHAEEGEEAGDLHGLWPVRAVCGGRVSQGACREEERAKGDSIQGRRRQEKKQKGAAWLGLLTGEPAPPIQPLVCSCCCPTPCDPSSASC